MAYRDLVWADGASHYWRLEEPSGTRAVDQIGGANGTIAGGVTLNQPGVLGDGSHAMTFDGATGWITTTPVTIPVPSTVEGWVNLSAAGGFHALFSTRGSLNGFMMGTNGATVTCYGDHSTPAEVDAAPISVGQWHHLVMVRTSTTVTFYIDGVPIAAAQTHGPVNSAGFISDVGNGNPWAGTIDEVALYPVALTAAQIAAHYAAGAPPPVSVAPPPLLNVSTVTLALLQLLQQDAPLRLILPDGVWFAEAPPGSTRFAIVQLVSSLEVPMFGGPAYKDTVYLVEARALMTTGTDVEAAFARITTLLTDAELTMPDFGAMLSQFEEELESVEVDDIDPSIRWNRCGGHLHVMVAPLVS